MCGPFAHLFRTYDEHLGSAFSWGTVRGSAHRHQSSVAETGALLDLVFLRSLASAILSSTSWTLSTDQMTRQTIAAGRATRFIQSC